MFKKVLVPLDGSEHSQKALETAIQIAKKFDAEITLLHVYSVTVVPMIIPEPSALTPAGVPVVTSAEVSKMIEAAREVGKQILKSGEEKVKSERINVEVVLREGNTVQEIAKAAEEKKSDLIVIGARGISKIRELLIGSISEGVIKHATCPVLVVK